MSSAQILVISKYIPESLSTFRIQSNFKTSNAKKTLRKGKDKVVPIDTMVYGRGGITPLMLNLD